MDKVKKSSVRLRVLFSMIIYVAIIAACVAIAIMSILYLNDQLHIVAGQDDVSAAVTMAEVQQKIYMYYVIFAVMIGVAVGFTIFCIYSIAKHIQYPLGTLQRASYHLTRTGNLRLPDDVRADMKKHSQMGDEISDAIISFGRMAENLQKKVEVLEVVARGDLRQRVDLAGDEDYLGIAVNTVVTSLSNIVRDVIIATEQLSIGANELSVGAQSLSQSSSEQSATMDKLHESANEIAAEAAENAERAGEASVLTAQIRSNATEGGRKMLDMSSAMSEINKASHSIGSVMKVIDEIAFQTNILALNAAVEAARAGVHGKGFAVVADEVRNLATKSGEAANDTNAMIADTISKSDMGTKIVDEATAFFKTIENGIANINELLDEITKAAKSQSHAIEKVTMSLTDMTNVVYHNSATSEESAAASEQMSSQALLLKETVNRFMLQDEDASTLIEFEAEQKGRTFDVPAPQYDYEKPEFNPTAAPSYEYEKPAFNPTAAPSYEYEKPAFNPTVAPSEDGGLSPAEIYAKALEREVHGIEPAPITEPVPAYSSEPLPIQIPDALPIEMPEPVSMEIPDAHTATIQIPEFVSPEPPARAGYTGAPVHNKAESDTEGGFVDDDSKY